MNRTARLAIVFALATVTAVAGPVAAECFDDIGWLDLHRMRNGAYAGTFTGDVFYGSIAITPLVITPTPDGLLPEPLFEVLYVDATVKGSFRAVIATYDEPITKTRLRRTGKGSIQSGTGHWETIAGIVALDTKLNLEKFTQKGEATFSFCTSPTK